MVHWRRKWQCTPVFLPQEPHEQYEKAKRYDIGRSPRSIGAQYATGERRNHSRRNEEAEPKCKQLLGVDVSGGKK